MLDPKFGAEAVQAVDGALEQVELAVVGQWYGVPVEIEAQETVKRAIVSFQ